MKSKCFCLSSLSILLFCVPFAALAAAPKPKPPSLDARVAALEAKVAALEALLADVTRLTDPNTGEDTMRFSGMNVQIVNGTGTTDTQAGTGNLIIGYNAPRGDLECPNGNSCDRRGGSHNLVIGDLNNYSFWGGMVVGLSNETAGEYASVSGGTVNKASNNFSSVSGGTYNWASGEWSSVSGGGGNLASADYASVSGGEGNEASGSGSSISGGASGDAVGIHSAISGGNSNRTEGEYSSVNGGEANKAIGYGSAVSGHVLRDAENAFCWEGDATQDC